MAAAGSGCRMADLPAYEQRFRVACLFILFDLGQGNPLRPDIYFSSRVCKEETLFVEPLTLSTQPLEEKNEMPRPGHAVLGQRCDL